MRIHLQALGCRLNEAELESWSRDFRALGHQIAPGAEAADLVVVNTCAVTAEAVRKSRKLMRRVRRANPAAKLVVSGCYASLSPEEAGHALGADLVVHNRDKDRLAEIACRELQVPAMPAAAIEPDACPLPAGSRQRAFVKVQDGCRYRCTYCIVTLARGEERSRTVAEVVAEITRLHAAGVQEVVLTGVHIGGYGSDLGSSLADLVRAVLERTAIPRVRIGSLEPWDVPDDFWDLFGDPRLMPHLHLPLQSGSDTVLRRMARRCRTEAFEALVRRARGLVPDLNITTDIIVGFPGETDEDWQRTMDYVERLGFGHVHIFPFSPRADTKAAALPGPVPRALVKERVDAMHALARRMKTEMLEGFRGRSLPVLVEGRRPEWEGYTPNFLRVEITDGGDPRLAGRIVDVRLEALASSGEALIGRRVDG
ncbi:MAG: tRNA (N(6)-L-threonylcarbamoyladenosine(37)-C(2))-methylthiotransferase MtaB [Chromatiales bacterium]|jgi:threonylcarbamoyladenosine tRNA methylthiotransferase MtaB